MFSDAEDMQTIPRPIQSLYVHNKGKYLWDEKVNDFFSYKRANTSPSDSCRDQGSK